MNKSVFCKATRDIITSSIQLDNDAVNCLVIIWDTMFH